MRVEVFSNSLRDVCLMGVGLICWKRFKGTIISLRSMSL